MSSHRKPSNKLRNEETEQILCKATTEKLLNYSSREAEKISSLDLCRIGDERIKRKLFKTATDLNWILNKFR